MGIGKTALMYLVSGYAWILLTGPLIVWLPERTARYYEAAKGLFYVSLTALLLYVLLKKMTRQRASEPGSASCFDSQGELIEEMVIPQAETGMGTVDRRQYLQKALKQALAAGQFTQQFQPILAADTGKIVSMEALIRWRHPTLGAISPAEFIPLAEECDEIIPIGRWMLLEACRKAKCLQKTQQCRLPVSVNVSAKQLRHGDIVVDVQEALAKSGLAPEYMILELTESIMIDPDMALHVMSRLKALGVKLSLDDFGTGFSSFSYLKRLPFDELKLDKSFTTDILSEQRDRQIVQSMIAMAHRLDMTVVGEGVEEKAQLDCLRSLGCDLVQGYYHYPPMDFKCLTTVTRERSTKSVTGSVHGR